MQHDHLEMVETKPQRTIGLSANHRAEGNFESEFTTRGVVGGLCNSAKFFFNGKVPVNNRTMDQYLAAVIRNENYVPDEFRTQVVGTGALGGFSAPETWEVGFWDFTANQSVFLPQCRTYNFQGNNVLHITKFDSADQTLGPTGSAAAQWVAEAGTFTPVDLKFKTATLKANKCGIFVDVSREAAQHGQGLVAAIGEAMSKAAAYSFDDTIMNGNGLGRPQGLLNSDSVIDVARAVANQIAYADVVSMYKRLYPPFIRNAGWF